MTSATRRLRVLLQVGMVQQGQVEAREWVVNHPAQHRAHNQLSLLPEEAD